jgi:hypothetical protein
MTAIEIPQLLKSMLRWHLFSRSGSLIRTIVALPHSKIVGDDRESPINLTRPSNQNGIRDRRPFYGCELFLDTKHFR